MSCICSRMPLSKAMLFQNSTSCNANSIICFAIRWSYSQNTHQIIIGRKQRIPLFSNCCPKTPKLSFFFFLICLGFKRNWRYPIGFSIVSLWFLVEAISTASHLQSRKYSPDAALSNTHRREGVPSVLPYFTSGVFGRYVILSSCDVCCHRLE
jgi:hypothetical protein